MSANKSSKPSNVLSIHTALQIAFCLVFTLGFIAAVATTAAAPDAGIDSAIRNPSVRSNILAPSQTRTPTLTLTPTQKAISSARAPVSALSVQTIPGQPQVDANTVALYHFDAPNGTDALDATGHFTGTLHGNATVNTSGLYGGVLQLDGIGSYVETPNLGSLSEGTIEAYVDFSSACATAVEDYPIITAVTANGDVMELGDYTGLNFGVYDNSQQAWVWAESGINPCRYLTGAPTNLPWPYETWRFHHVAGTWGPRGVEIWVDGVLHGVGNTDPYAGSLTYSCNPQMQTGEQGYPPNPLYPVCMTPVMAPKMTPSYPRGDYVGGLLPYNTFRIGCDFNANGACFNGRIDEVRVSNIQRVFAWTVDPTVTPIPTQTPVPITSAYTVDTKTRALFHLDYQVQMATFSAVLEEVTQQYRGLGGQAYITPYGRFNSGLGLDGNGSYLDIGDPSHFSAGTVEAWVKFSSTDVNQPIISAVASRSIPSSMLVSLQILPSGTLGFSLRESDNLTLVSVDSGVPVSQMVNCWHQVVGTWGARGLEIWIDGSLVNANTSYTGGMVNYDADDWRAGCDFGGHCMEGIIDEVRVSDVQRTFTASTLAPLLLPFPGIRSGIRAPADGETETFLPFVRAVPPLQCPFGN